MPKHVVIHASFLLSPLAPQLICGDWPLLSPRPQGSPWDFPQLLSLAQGCLFPLLLSGPGRWVGGGGGGPLESCYSSRIQLAGGKPTPGLAATTPPVASSGERGDRGKAGGGSNPHWAPTFSMVASLSGNTGDFTAPSIRQPKPTSHPSMVTPLLGGSGWGHLLPYPGPQPTPRLDWFRRVGRGLGRGFQGPLLNRQLLKVEGQGLLPVKQGAPPPPSLLRSWDKLITFSSAR